MLERSLSSKLIIDLNESKLGIVLRRQASLAKVATLSIRVFIATWTQLLARGTCSNLSPNYTSKRSILKSACLPYSKPPCNSLALSK